MFSTARRSREFTIKLLTMVDEGLVDPTDALRACLERMPEADVEEMMHANNFVEEDETTDDTTEDLEGEYAYADDDLNDVLGLSLANDRYFDN
jgi:hypothetical protein